MDLFCFDSGGNLRKWVKLTLLNTRGYTLDLRKRHCLCQCFSLSLVGWRQAGKQEGMEVKRRKEEKEDRRNKRSGEGTWSLEWSVKKDPHSTLNDPSQSPGPMARTAEGEGVLWDSGGCPTITCSFVPLKGLTISHEYKNNQPSKLVCASWVVSLNISSNMPIILSINRLKIHGTPQGAGGRKLCKALRKVTNFLIS